MRFFKEVSMKRAVVWVLAVLFTCMMEYPACGRPTVRVVTTLPIFADLVRQVGGELVEVVALAPSAFDPHTIEPRPSDVWKVKKADIFVHAGLDLEPWRSPLLDAAGNPRLFPGQPGELDLSQGVRLLEVPDRPVSRLEGDIHLFGNPHYWLDPHNVRTMVQAIAEKLAAYDPDHASNYRQNLNAFLNRLQHKIPQWQEKLRPYQGHKLIGYHNEWIYLMEFAGLKMETFLEPKPGIPPGPKHLAFVEDYAKRHGVRLIVQAAYNPKQAAQAMAKRIGLKVVVLCQNVGDLPEASDYFALMDYNVDRLVLAL